MGLLDSAIDIGVDIAKDAATDFVKDQFSGDSGSSVATTPAVGPRGLMAPTEKKKKTADRADDPTKKAKSAKEKRK